MSKVIHWSLRKKFKFDHTNICYMYHLESVLEKEILRLLWNFEIQMDHLISARQPDLLIVNQKKKKRKKKKERTCWIVNFAIPADH